MTDPRLTPHGDHNQSTFLGDIPYNRLMPGDNITSLRIPHAVRLGADGEQ